ncbi:MAG: hypothetical protein QXF01_01935, partial [Candidatus Micrarchaeaceae archaeon]
LSILYGVGAGAVIQSTYNNNATIAPSVAPAAQQLVAIHDGILESYILFLVATAAMGGAFLIFIRRNERSSATQSRYVPFHVAMVAVFALILYVIISEPYMSARGFYMYVTYSGIGISLACDLFLEYLNRTHSHSKVQGLRHTIAIDPKKPFSNLIALRESIFSNLSGHLRIIDKHFNTTALANLHRLVYESIGNLSKITILTSKEMLDSDISSSVSDFRAELSGSGIELELKLMDDKDAVEQHERIMLDDKIAYKVPPFNIINKKSEHITTISHSQAERRFEYLYKRAIKLENYATKASRPAQHQPQPEENAGGA